MKAIRRRRNGTYHYKHDPENPLKEKPKFYFTVNTAKAKEQKSGDVEIGQKIKIVVKDIFDESYGELKFVLYQVGTDNSTNCNTNSDGLFEKEDLVPGKYEIKFKKGDK